MKTKWITILIFIWVSTLIAQSNDVKLSKGEVFDILPLKFNENADSLSVKRYMKDAILPKAIELGYKPIMAISIGRGDVIQGNYSPDVLLFGGWKNKSNLHSSMEQLESDFPDFHSLRREIWTVFYNTHYELSEDLNFRFLSSKFYVATSYWKKQTTNLDSMINVTIHNIHKHNGKLTLNLLEGESPYGYYYNPDYFFITEWNSENDFKKFKKENQSQEKQKLKHINQFKLNIK